MKICQRRQQEPQENNERKKRNQQAVGSNAQQAARAEDVDNIFWILGRAVHRLAVMFAMVARKER